MGALTPDAVVRPNVPRGNAVAVDARSRDLETVGERAHPRLTYRPDLDGLRALAVLGVFAAHAQLPLGDAAGRTGVNVFFVLSGYLITGILLAQPIDLRSFYIRRARRLLPAFLAVVAFVVLVGLAGGWGMAWQPGVVGSLAYVGNWVIVGGGDLGPLNHTWSLSIEEQFYLAWPFVVLLGRRKLVLVAALGIAVAVLARMILSEHEGYFATVTRIDALFAGALLAVFRPKIPRWAGTVAFVTTIVALAVPWTDASRLPVTTVLTLVMIAAGVPVVGRLAAMGRRSYGIYLWGTPLTVLMGPLLGIPAAFAAAEISYRTIEARFRRPRQTFVIRMNAGFQLPSPPAPAPIVPVPLPVTARIE